MNSLYVLFGFLAFTALGYLSLVRLLYKQELAGQPFVLGGLKRQLTQVGLLEGLARSGLVVGLPSLALILFYGWGPALLWVVMAHLLLETPGNFITSRMQQQVNLERHFSDFSDFNSSIRALVFQLLLLALTTLMLVLLARLIDNQTGLLFALASVLISINLLRTAKSSVDAVIKFLSSIGLLALGLLMANNMGIAVFGQMQPADETWAWLRIDSQTLLVVLLLVLGLQVSRQDTLRRGVFNVVGVLIILLVLALLVYLLWQQPVLDAPPLSSEERAPQLPAFTSIFFLLSPALVFLTSLLHNRMPRAEEGANLRQTSFLRQQSVGLITLCFTVVLIVALGTANGIGAWNTHFVSWNSGLDLLQYFDLVVSVVSATTGAALMSAKSGQTLLIIAVCLLGLAALLNLIRRIDRQVAVAKAESGTFLGQVFGQLLPQCLLLLIASAWALEHGVNVLTWVWIMSLGWVLCSDVMLDYASDMNSASVRDHLRRGYALLLFGLGAMQLIWTAVNAVATEQLLFAGALAVSLALGVVLGWRNALACAQALRVKEDSTLFEDSA